VVLVFQITAVAPTDDHRRQCVLTGPGVGGQVKLGRQSRPLAVAHLLAVDPQEKGGLNPIEADEDFSICPVSRNGEGVTIQAGGVILRDKGGIGRKGHLDVGVNRLIVAVHHPVARYGKFVPVRGVKIGPVEIAGSRIGIRDQLELPMVIEQLEVGRFLSLVRQGRYCIRIGDQWGMGRQFVYPNHLGIFPISI